MNGRALIEVAVDRRSDARTALAHGADRIEYCARLDTGGLTPQMWRVRELALAAPGKLAVLIRERPGPFTADASTVDWMCKHAAEALEAGAVAVVFGVLTDRNEIDVEGCRRVITVCDQGSAVFHRAFDFCRDPLRALDTLISMGFRRLLTSGGASVRAPGAVDRLAELVRRASGAIEIIPGGGVRADNAAEILQRTACGQLHSSCRRADGTFDVNELAALRAAAVIE